MLVDEAHQPVAKLHCSCLTMANVDGFVGRLVSISPLDNGRVSDGQRSVQSQLADMAIVLVTALTYFTSALIMLGLIGSLLSLVVDN